MLWVLPGSGADACCLRHRGFRVTVTQGVFVFDVGEVGGVHGSTVDGVGGRVFILFEGLGCDNKKVRTEGNNRRREWKLEFFINFAALISLP